MKNNEYRASVAFGLGIHVVVEKYSKSLELTPKYKRDSDDKMKTELAKIQRRVC